MVAADTSQLRGDTIAIAYDGPNYSDGAIVEAARMSPGADSVVMPVWTSICDPGRPRTDVRDSPSR